MLPYNSLTFYDDFSFEKNEKLRDFVKSPEIITILESIGEQCVMVLGGDGSMLRAIGEHAEKQIPFLGINFGHKGFLLNHQEWIDHTIPQFEARKYPLLDIYCNGQEVGQAFNDIHLYSPEGKVLSLDLHNSFGKVKLWGDGLVLATPAGSTGHSKSYGGPILPHKSENLVLSPKGNITPQSPKALDDSEAIRINNIGRKYPLALNIDGVQTYVSSQDEELELIVQKSQKTVSLLIAQNHLRDWDNKVMQEQGFTP